MTSDPADHAEPDIHVPVDLPVEEDRGLAAERTDIAWARSGLAMVTCLAGVIKRVPTMNIATRWGLAAFATIAAIIATTLARGRVRHASRVRMPIDATAARLRMVAVNTALVGVLCLAVVASAAW